LQSRHEFIRRGPQPKKFVTERILENDPPLPAKRLPPHLHTRPQANLLIRHSIPRFAESVHVLMIVLNFPTTHCQRQCFTAHRLQKSLIRGSLTHSFQELKENSPPF
jgi:hypothetical protein